MKKESRVNILLYTCRSIKQEDNNFRSVQMYFGMYPWNWGESFHRAQFSPRSSSASSRESSEGDSGTGLQSDQSKRGRPRAEKISALILKGSVSNSSIRCKICSRVFPREKSLQAHLRTHTGRCFCSLSLSLYLSLSLSLSLSESTAFKTYCAN